MGADPGPWLSIRCYPQHKTIVLTLALKAGLGGDGPKSGSGSLGLKVLPVPEETWLRSSGLS